MNTESFDKPFRSWIILLSVYAMIATALCSCNKKTPPKQNPPKVSIASIEQRDVPLYLETIGQAIPPVTVEIRPQVSGKLIATYIKQGDIVEEGQLLYTMDPRPFQAALDQAKAQLEKDKALLQYAEKTVERYKQVVEQDFISQLTYEQYESNAGAARGQVEADKAAIVSAEINLQYCNVTAPVAGKISYFNVDVGNILIAYDTNAITIIRPFNPIDILFSLPQHQFESVRHDQGDAGNWEFIAALPEHPQELFKGTSYFVDNQVNQDTGTILIKGRLHNSSRSLWPGEFVKVKVLQKMLPKALIAPPGAILIGKDGPYLYSIDKEGKAASHNVKVLSRTEDYIAFESKELKAGDTVITDGQINVAPGIIVSPIRARPMLKDIRDAETK